ncbi:MAG: hypothetical protein D3922_08030, partial [Candidatus Electrothrix sp. AR1]|nr:hypothetical protein [Candidatus Electrothrix sp. AR1]
EIMTQARSLHPGAEAMMILPVVKQAAGAQEATFRSKRIFLCLLCLNGEGSPAALRHFYFLRLKMTWNGWLEMKFRSLLQHIGQQSVIITFYSHTH